MEYTDNEIVEKASEFKVECGCYELEDFCYDGTGEPTHSPEEECNN